MKPKLREDCAAKGSGSRFAIFVFQVFGGSLQFLVELLPEFSDQRFTQKTKYPELCLESASARGIANGPMVVIEGKVLSNVADANGIKMTGYGFVEITLPGTVGAFHSTLGHAALIVMHKGALGAIDKRAYEFTIYIYYSQPLLAQGLDAFRPHEGFDGWQVALYGLQLFFFQGCAALSFHAAGAFAGSEITQKVLLQEIIAHEYRINLNHGSKVRTNLMTYL